MKQIIQSYKTGLIDIFDVPPPVCGENGVVVRTINSLVSAGTEKMLVDLAKKSLLGKAQARPDLVKQVFEKMKQEGIQNTLEKVFNKLDTPIPLGYSCMGEVIEVGKNVKGIQAGDRVACGGAGFANHSEFNFVPSNLVVKVPSAVGDEEASFVSLGAIALQGLRQASPTLGERIVVMGLGLIGQITIQLLKANGCKVLGVDIDPHKLDLAKVLGADEVCLTEGVIQKAAAFSQGFGVDATIITASTSSSQPIHDAGIISRIKGRVVVVGMVGMDIPRNEFYKKELEVKLSMSYGPGRYDDHYEKQGIDYPIAYVRWTEQRNFEAFLQLIAENKIQLQKLISHRIPFENALQAYELFAGKSNEPYLGIVLQYAPKQTLVRDPILISSQAISSHSINIGLVGAGNFTRGILLPQIKKSNDLKLLGLCTATGISAHTIGKKYGFKWITTDYQELLQLPEINTLFIATRHHDHGQKILEGLKSGKNVFVEKPLTIDEQELDSIQNYFLNNSITPILQVGYNRRFAPMVQEMKKQLGQQHMAIVYRVNAGPIPLDSWIQDPHQGGGRIVGEMCHFVDTAMFLAGSSVKSLFAQCVRSNDSSIPDEDNLNVLIQFENGSTAAIHYFAYGHQNMPKESIEVFAKHLAMRMDNFRELTIHYKHKSKTMRQSNQNKGFAEELQAFEKAVKSGIPAIPYQTILEVSRLTFAIIKSLQLQLPVNIQKPY